MDDTYNFSGMSMPPLPAPLAAAFDAAAGGGGKRERTQAQLIQAAVKVLAARGLAPATIQEVAQVAGVTTGTVYNHFASKEALVERVAVTLADSLCRAIDDSYSHITDGAERMAIGQRRYIWLAAASPGWTLMLLDVLPAAPKVLEEIQKYALADLRLGVKQKKFKVASEAAAMDLINGMGTFAMRRVALGLAPPNHDTACAALVLRGLGLPADQAAEVAKRPLPEFRAADAPHPNPLPEGAREPARTRSGVAKKSATRRGA
jgi:AcrR family transcriptional regulator